MNPSLPTQEEVADFIDAAIKSRERALDAYINRYGINIVNERDTTSHTALMWAAIGGNAPILRKLLEAGADPDLTCMADYTALQYAAYKGDEECIKLLLKASTNSEAGEGEDAVLRLSQIGNNPAGATALFKGWSEQRRKIVDTDVSALRSGTQNAIAVRSGGLKLRAPK